MTTEYANYIKEVDLTLAMLREGWMKAKVDEKSRWLDRINSMLDERNRLMKLRDSVVTVIN